VKIQGNDNCIILTIQSLKRNGQMKMIFSVGIITTPKDAISKGLIS